MALEEAVTTNTLILSVIMDISQLLTILPASIAIPPKAESFILEECKRKSNLSLKLEMEVLDHIPENKTK